MRPSKQSTSQVSFSTAKEPSISASSGPQPSRNHPADIPLDLAGHLAAVESAFLEAGRRGEEISRLERLRAEWRGLLLLVSRSAARMTRMLNGLSSDSKTSLERDFEESRIDSLRGVAKVIGMTRDKKVKSTDGFNVLPLYAQSMRQLISSINSLPNDDPVGEDISRLRKEFQSQVEDRLNAAIEGRRVVSYPAGSEFTLTSEPDELNSLRSTNTQRWLTDVLKWQVIDINLQRRRRGRGAELAALVEEKKKMIFSILDERVFREVTDGVKGVARIEAVAQRLLQVGDEEEKAKEKVRLLMKDHVPPVQPDILPMVSEPDILPMVSSPSRSLSPGSSIAQEISDEHVAVEDIKTVEDVIHDGGQANSEPNREIDEPVESSIEEEDEIPDNDKDDNVSDEESCSDSIDLIVPGKQLRGSHEEKKVEISITPDFFADLTVSSQFLKKKPVAQIVEQDTIEQNEVEEGHEISAEDLR